MPKLKEDGIDTDQQVVDLVDELARGMRENEAVDLEAFVAEHSEHADALRKLFPALGLLAHLNVLEGDASVSATRVGQTCKEPTGIGASEPKEGVLGDYRIVREIGRGGMGVVYEARQISLGRRVALKVLPFAAMLDKQQLKRFQNEARAAATLDHPNVVHVYSVGHERGVYYYAMQLIEGQSMAAVIAELLRLSELDADEEGQADVSNAAISGLTSDLASDRFAPPSDEQIHRNDAGTLEHRAAAETRRRTQAVLSTERSTNGPQFFRTVAQLGIQAAAALDHAHQSGVIHRDVKPANLLLDADGKLWVTDFGLARIEADAGMTMTGDMLGTLRYMSPEQMLGKRASVDHRVDIYSLGATLYELLTLQPAYPADDRQELLRQVANEEPRPPRRLRREIPTDLETIVLKAICKNPSERYATAGDLADDLQRFLEQKPIEARRPTLLDRIAKWSRRHQPAIVGAAASLVMLVTVAGGLLLANNLKMQEERKRTEAETQRAEANFKKAREAVDRMFTRAASELADKPHMEKIRRALLEDALEFYQSFLDQKGDDPTIRQETARAYLRVGNIRHELGDIAEADKALKKGVEDLRTLSNEYPSNVSYRLDLAGGLGALAYLHLWSGGGVTFRQQEVTLYEQLTIDYPDEPRYLAALADAQIALGNAFSVTGRQNRAEKFLRESVSTWRNLEKEFPEHPYSISRQAASYHWLGALLLWQNVEEAEPLLRRAMQQREKLVADHPSRSGYRANLAHTKTHYGILRQYQGKLDEAIKLYGEAIELRKGVLDDFPSTLEHRRRLGDIYQRLSEALSLSGKQQESLEAIRKSLHHLEYWAKSKPEYARVVGRVHYRIGIALYDLGRVSEAAEAFLMAQTILHDCIEKTDGQHQAMSDLALLYGTCPLHQFRDGKRAVELAKMAVQDKSESPLHWGVLAAAHLEADNWPEVIITLRQMPIEESRWNARDWFCLAISHWKLDRKEQAHRSYQKGMAWMKKHPFTNPEFPRFRDEAAEVLGIEKPTAPEKEKEPLAKPPDGDE